MSTENKTYNLFIVRSPLQLVNAIEARHHFKTENNILCLIHNRSISNSQQMKALLSLIKWDVFFELNAQNKKNNFFKNIRLIYKLRKHIYNYIITGDVGSLNIPFISSLKKNHVYLVDDGTATFNLHKGTLNPKVGRKKNIDNFIKKYRYILFGLKYDLHEETINYFTIFDIIPHGKEKVLNNRFEFLKRNFLNNIEKETNVVYLLGQNFVEINAMTQEIYLNYINEIKKYYKDKTILYYPHRSEKITPEYDTLNSKTFVIKSANQPIELELVMGGIYPMYIASFTSSALFTLHHIFSDANIDSFVINPKDLLSHHETVQMLYDKQVKSINQISFH